MGEQEVQIKPWQKIAYSSGNFPVNLMAQMFATYIVFYYVDHLGVKPALIGLAMVIHGIFGAILNPLIGYLSDNTRSKWGRRVPYITFGIIPLAASFTLVWIPLGPSANLFWYFLIIVLLYDIFYILVVLNWTSLFPEMFTKLKDRTSVSSWRQMIGIIGMIIGVALPPIIYGQIGWTAMGILFGCLCLIFFAISILGSKEPKHERPAAHSISFLSSLRYTFTNKAFVTYVLGSFFVQLTFALLPAAIPFFTKYVLLNKDDTFNTIMLGTIFVIAMPMVYVWGRLTNKWGTRKTIMTAAALYMISLIPFAFVTGSISAIVTTACVGLCLAGLIVLLDVLIAEIVDDDETRTGERREGMYYGMNGFIMRWGVSLQAVIMSGILEGTGYSADIAVQPDATVFGIRMMLSGIPVVCLLFGLLFYYFYPLGRSESKSSNITVSK
ncbi:MFS transporter [Paenibacillus albiflavus]|uniref:MFS transporter n=1 Tax=Paenibacillus albiflavus TaxID=2545760 RepID=A0A4R4E171_9BACL|nr:MFS transporter [Paenibacillus albiflavus]TCZ71053.1 MFS transporter [Paenibacillus albiflavus]